MISPPKARERPIDHDRLTRLRRAVSTYAVNDAIDKGRAAATIDLVDAMKDREWLAENVRRILLAVGNPAKCRGCNADIIWVTHANGERTPYTPLGLNHFIDCPKRDDFRRGKERSNGKRSDNGAA